MVELGIGIFLALVVAVAGIISLRTPALAGPLFVGLFLRLLVAWAAQYAVTLPYSTSDAVYFERRAWRYAQGGWTAIIDTFDASSSHVISSLWAVQYLLFGRSVWLPLLTNILLAVLTIWLVYRAAGELWTPDAARLAAWVAALMPSAVLFSAVLLRETAVVFLVAAGSVSFLRFHRSGRLVHLILGGIAFAAGAMLHGGIAFVGIAWLAGLATVEAVRILRRSGIRRSAVKIGALAGFTAGAIWIWLVSSDVHLGSVGVIDAAELADEVVGSVPRVQRGGSDYLLGWGASSPAEALVQAPIRIVYFLLSPLAWQVRSITQLIGLVDGLLILLLCFGAWRDRHSLMADRRSVILMLSLAVGVVIFALGTFNAGTALRHRAKFLPMIVVLAAPGVGQLLGAGAGKSRRQTHSSSGPPDREAETGEFPQGFDPHWQSDP